MHSDFVAKFANFAIKNAQEFADVALRFRIGHTTLQPREMCDIEYIGTVRSADVECVAFKPAWTPLSACPRCRAPAQECVKAHRGFACPVCLTLQSPGLAMRCTTCGGHQCVPCFNASEDLAGGAQIHVAAEDTDEQRMDTEEPVVAIVEPEACTAGAGMGVNVSLDDLARACLAEKRDAQDQDGGDRARRRLA